MSAHDWPEFEKHPEYDEWIVDTVALTKAQYNYAKVRIDKLAAFTTEQIEAGIDLVALVKERDALQQRCEELLTDNAKMKQLLLHFLYHHQGASSVIGQPIRILFGMNDHEHMTDDQIAIAKQVQPCNTPTK